MSRCRLDTYQAEMKTKFAAGKDCGLLTIEDELT
jgi:hypothetical protein